MLDISSPPAPAVQGSQRESALCTCKSPGQNAPRMAEAQSSPPASASLDCSALSSIVFFLMQMQMREDLTLLFYYL